MIIKAAVYARTNNEEELRGHGIDAQMKRAQDVCSENGWTLAKIYEDNEDVDANLPGLERLLSEASEYDEVLVWHSGKLSFPNNDQLSVIGKLNAQGIIPHGWTWLTPFKSLELGVGDDTFFAILEHADNRGDYRGRAVTVKQEGSDSALHSFHVGISNPRLSAIANQPDWHPSGYYDMTEFGTRQIALEKLTGTNRKPTHVLDEIEIYLMDPIAFYAKQDPFLAPSSFHRL